MLRREAAGIDTLDRDHQIGGKGPRPWSTRRIISRPIPMS
jgi:hypothetical protein